MRCSLIIILLTLLSSSLLIAQEETDTVFCGRNRIILKVPIIAYKNSKIINYEEGFYKIYPNSDSSYLLIHFGSMVNLPIFSRLDTCNITGKYQLGNIALSIRGYFDNKCYREDRYLNQKITVLYSNINKVGQLYFDELLDKVNIQPK